MVDLKAVFFYKNDPDLVMILNLQRSAQYEEPFTRRYGGIMLRAVVKNEDDWEYLPDAIEKARNHHKRHGDMDGKTCLLNRCELHYPRVKV